ncbi:MAG TPA: sulfotransferase [Gammaproteobacteria bacterium]|nr:sulfotransferase [Gammaproteobacteria bacterium]
MTPTKLFNNQPIFLVGAERSGTTLLRLMLDHHPELAFHFEFEFSVDQMRDGKFPAVQDYIEYLETDRIFHASELSIDASLDYPQLIQSFLQQWQDKSGKQFVGATVHRDFNRLLKIWPDAKFIHLIRDPRDVARSCVAMNWAGNTYAGVDKWIEAEQVWDDLSLTLAPESQIELHFESLVTNPVSCLTELCEFIGTKYDPAMFSYAEKTSYDLPKASLAYQWRKKASQKEIQQVEAKIGNRLSVKGYTTSGLSKISMTPLRGQRLSLQSKWLVKLSRIKVYGLPLVMASWLSKRLNIKPWEKHVALRCNQIDTELLK